MTQVFKELKLPPNNCQAGRREALYTQNPFRHLLQRAQRQNVCEGTPEYKPLSEQMLRVIHNENPVKFKGLVNNYQN